MDGLSFRVADPVPAEREARVRAMAEARARADVLAEATGLSIEGVTDIVEGSPMRPPMPIAKAERMMLASDASAPVEAGSLEIVVTVSVTYRARWAAGPDDQRRTAAAARPWMKLRCRTTNRSSGGTMAIAMPAKVSPWSVA